MIALPFAERRENEIMALSADIRRVVTTIDDKNKAVVLLDGARQVMLPAAS